MPAAKHKSSARFRVRIKPRKRKNLFGFGKKTTHSSALLRDAHAAGRKSGDTAQFSSWLAKQKPGELAGSLKRRLKERYNSGVHSLWSEEKKAEKKATVEKKKEAKSVKQQVLDYLDGQGMKHAGTSSIVKRSYKKGDSYSELLKKVMARNPKKFDRCVKDVKKSLKKTKRKGSAYAICTAAGTRNKRKGTKSKNALVRLTQGSGTATVKQRGFLNWDVQIIKPGHKVIDRSFDTYQGALAFARLKLHDLANNPSGADLVPGASTIQAWADAGHRVFRGVKKAGQAGFKKAKKLVGRNAYGEPTGFKKSALRYWYLASGGPQFGGEYPTKAEALKALKQAKKAGYSDAAIYASKYASNRKSNPLDLAQQRHEEFTGFPSQETLELIQKQHVHTHLAGLAQFVCFIVVGTDGKLLNPVMAPGMKYTGPAEEMLADYDGPFRAVMPQVKKPLKGDWTFDLKTPAKEIVWLTASEQREKNGKNGKKEEIKQQLYLSGGDQELNPQALRYLGMNGRDMHDNMLLGTIARVWYWTRKVFEAEGKEKVWFFHDFGKEGSGGICPVLLYHPLDPSFEIAGGRYYIALPEKKLGASPGIVG